MAIALQVIDPSTNSIGYLYIIDLLMTNGPLPSNFGKEAVMDKIVSLLTCFDPVQIRYVGGPFRHLLDTVSSGTWFPVSTVQIRPRSILT